MYKTALFSIIGFLLGSIISVTVFDCSIKSGVISFCVLSLGYLICFFQRRINEWSDTE